jgi:hypothetical protein
MIVLNILISFFWYISLVKWTVFIVAFVTGNRNETPDRDI